MSKITTIMESNGTTEVTTIDRNGTSFVAGGGWKNLVAKAKAHATHSLTRHEQDGNVFWLVEWVHEAERTCPLYTNISFEEVAQRLLAYYTGDECIIYFK